MAKLKAWAGYLGGKEHAVIVATSQLRAAELAQTTVHDIRLYFSLTGNPEQLALIEHGEGLYLERPKGYVKESQ